MMTKAQRTMRYSKKWVRSDIILAFAAGVERLFISAMVLFASVRTLANIAFDR